MTTTMTSLPRKEIDAGIRRARQEARQMERQLVDA